MASIATLNIDIKATAGGFTSGINRAQVSLTGFQRGLNATTVAVGNFASAMAQKAVAAIKDFTFASVGVASDAIETRNKFRAVFKDMADDVEGFVARTGKSLGRNKGELRDALSAFQGFFVGLEFGGEKAADLSKELVSLSLDFASFHNLTDDEALTRFISALSGSAEVMDKFGVNVKAAALDQEFLRQGLDLTTRTATEQQKTLARLSIIRRALASQGAIGDAERTKNEFAGLNKQLAASFQELKEQIGAALIPIIKEHIPAVIGGLKKIAPEIVKIVGSLGDLASKVDSVKGLTDAFSDMADQLNEVNNLLSGKLPTSFKALEDLFQFGAIGRFMKSLPFGQDAIKRNLPGAVEVPKRDDLEFDPKLFNLSPEDRKFVIDQRKFRAEVEEEIQALRRRKKAERDAAGKAFDEFDLNKALQPSLKRRGMEGLFDFGEAIGKALGGSSIGKALGSGLSAIGRKSGAAEVQPGFAGFGADAAQASRNVERARFAAMSRAGGPETIAKEQLATQKNIFREARKTATALRDFGVEVISSFR